MKKILLIFALLVFCISVCAEEILKIDYKSIEDEAKIKVVDSIWTDKVARKDNDYLVKILNADRTSNYYFNNGDFAFDLNCDYEFIYKGDLIAYSNSDLKFYEITYTNGLIDKRELLEDEVKALFPEFKIIKISEFNNSTNSLKIKKESHNFKILLLNDTDRIFNNYSFTTGYSKFKKYPLLGMINVQKKGMIQFSQFGENTKKSPWFILLFR